MSSIVESHLSELEYHPKRSNQPVAQQETAGNNILSRAEEQFPYLKGKNINVVVNPDSKIGGKLEFYDDKETGTGDTPRPEGIPLGQVGVEIKDKNVRPIDLLGDYVSHYAVYNDPKLKPLYDEFVKTIPEKQQRDRYNYAVKNFGEDRSYEDWKEMSGDPGMLRGYVFDQFPKEELDKIYSPEQIKLLDKVKNYLGIPVEQKQSSTDIMDKIAMVESSNQHTDAKGNLTKSKVGALGKYQIMPETARDPGYGIKPIPDLKKASESEHKRFATDYFAKMLELFNNDEEKALAAYNAGPKVVMEAVKKDPTNWKKYVPKESRKYIEKVASL